MLKLYKRFVLPKLIDKKMRSETFNTTRSSVVESAKGLVLEIGFGSGYNVPFYKNIERLYVVEPSIELFNYAKERIESAPFSVEYVAGSAEMLPFESNTFDTIVSTWTLCSVSDLSKSLVEIHRVLKPGGRFLFVEHGKAQNKLSAVFQKLLTPISRLYAGNCHLDRKIDSYILNSGLIIHALDVHAEDGRPLMCSYRGVATKK